MSSVVSSRWGPGHQRTVSARGSSQIPRTARWIGVRCIVRGDEDVVAHREPPRAQRGDGRPGGRREAEIAALPPDAGGEQSVPPVVAGAGWLIKHVRDRVGILQVAKVVQAACEDPQREVGVAPLEFGTDRRGDVGGGEPGAIRGVRRSRTRDERLPDGVEHGRDEPDLGALVALLDGDQPLTTDPRRGRQLCLCESPGPPRRPDGRAEVPGVRCGAHRRRSFAPRSLPHVVVRRHELLLLF